MHLLINYAKTFNEIFLREKLPIFIEELELLPELYDIVIKRN